MATHEMKGDLVRAAGDGMSVAHCVSADFAMGAGIARQLDDAFGIRAEILREFVAGAAARIAVGDVIELRRVLSSTGATISIYNLITKKTHRDLPTYESFESAVAMLKKACARRNQEVLAVPRMGCGIDRLEWPRVREILDRNFVGSGTFLHVLVL